jgi:hypothetical protein
MHDYPFLFFETLLVSSVYKFGQTRYNINVSSVNKLTYLILKIKRGLAYVH